MPTKSHKFIRHLVGRAAKAAAGYAVERYSPHLSAIFETGKEFLRHTSPDVAAIVDSLDLSGHLGKLPETVKSFAKSFVDQLHMPNASVPSPVFRGMSNVGMQNQPTSPSSGMLNIGTTQPIDMQYKGQPHPSVANVRSILPSTVPFNGFTAWPQEKLGKTPSDASESGWYFRKVGPGTNIVRDAPGYGEDASEMIKGPLKVYDRGDTIQGVPKYVESAANMMETKKKKAKKMIDEKDKKHKKAMKAAMKQSVIVKKSK